MKFNDLLVGKHSSEKKFQMADSLTGVCKSYTCHEMCEAMKLNDLMAGKAASIRNPKLRNLKVTDCNRCTLNVHLLRNGLSKEIQRFAGWQRNSEKEIPNSVTGVRKSYTCYEIR